MKTECVIEYGLNQIPKDGLLRLKKYIEDGNELVFDGHISHDGKC